MGGFFSGFGSFDPTGGDAPTYFGSNNFLSTSGDPSQIDTSQGGFGGGISFPLPGGDGGGGTAPTFPDVSNTPGYGGGQPIDWSSVGAAASSAPSWIQTLLKSGQALAPLLNAGGNVAGGLLALQQQNFLNNGKTATQNNLNGLGQNAQGNINNLAPLLSFLGPQAVAGAQNYTNNTGGATGWATNVLNSQNPLARFSQMVDPNSIPGLGAQLGTNNSLQSYLANVLGGVTGQLGQGAQGLQAALQAGLNPASQVANGATPGQQALQTTGASLLGGSQNNPYVQALQQVGMGSLAQHGYTPQLNQVTQQGQQLLQPNPAVQQAQSVAGQIIGHNPLMSMQQVVSQAVDQNATQSRNQADALKRQLMDRTGVTGPMVAGGGQNELLNGLGNQALQNQSSAVTNAMAQQQALQEQLFSQGTGLFNAATGANLGYQGQGLNAILQSSNQAGSLQQILGQLGLGGGNLGINQAATGGSLLSQGAQTQLGGLSALTGLGGLGNQNYLGSLGAINNLSGTQNAAGSSLIQALLGSQGLGLQQNSGGYNALQGLLSTLTQGAGQGIQEQQASTAPISQQLEQWIQSMMGAGTSQVGLFGNAAPTNYFSNILGSSHA